MSTLFDKIKLEKYDFCVKRLQNQIGGMNSSYIRHSFIHELQTSRERFFSKISNLLFNQYFYKKLSHYIQLQNFHLGLGFELCRKDFEI